MPSGTYLSFSYTPHGADFTAIGTSCFQGSSIEVRELGDRVDTITLD
jgi:hypothetical protein